MLSPELRAALLTFRSDRDWEQFHTPKNLAIALSVEAAELLELFQWTNESEERPDPARLRAIEEELGDLAILLTYLGHDLGIDLEAAAQRKLMRNGERYPVSLSRGNATKHSALPTSARPMSGSPRFIRYIGIDYSGAETPTASLSGLRIYETNGHDDPHEVLPPPGPKKYWTRRGVAEWLAIELQANEPTLVGIDHGFSFPLEYFKAHALPLAWDGFLEDFTRHWPTHLDNVYVDFIREGEVGNGAARMGNTKWRRLTERRAGAAKSVFHFDVQGSVAKSTHAGIPWLRFLRDQEGDRLHFWPFDGWDMPAGHSAVVEVYPSLWSRAQPRGERTPDQHDAYVVAAALATADRDGSLKTWLHPALSDIERRTAEVEGWILGVD